MVESHTNENQKMETGTITKAYAYLNIDHPLCAWATYRGILVSPPSEPGFVSVWHASVLKFGGCQKIVLEQKMETVRQDQFSTCTSRLRGMYCFTDLNSARLRTHKIIVRESES